jgi:site-specific DNA recombinase
VIAVVQGPQVRATSSIGSVSRIPATEIENIVIRSVKQHLGGQRGEPSAGNAYSEDRSLIAEQVVRIDVHEDCLMVRFKLADQEESHSTEGELISVAWENPPSRKAREILVPIGASRSEVRPTRIERRATCQCDCTGSPLA